MLSRGGEFVFFFKKFQNLAPLPPPSSPGLTLIDALLSQVVLEILSCLFLLQVALAWGIKRGTPVIPKAVSENHIKENLEALHVNLDEDDMKEVEQIEIRFRYFKMHWIYKSKEIPKDLWDGED